MEQTLAIFNPWWEGPFKAEGIRREAYLRQLDRKRKTKDIVFITGLRRVGKTTLVRQYAERLIGSGEDPRRILYFSMDHPGLVRESILDVLDAYRRIHGMKHSDRFTAIIDEVHLREGFEQELKAIYDLGHVKVFATGSSSLFMVERGSFLTGRQTFMEVFPFAFPEYMGLMGLEARRSDAHLMVKYGEDYVRAGGLPEYLKTGDPGYLTTLVSSVLYKDIAARRGVRNVEALRELLLVVTQSTGSKLSPRRIGRILGVSHETVREHLSSFEEANLIHTLRLKGKVSESLASPKKVYATDTGIVHVLSPTVNLGSLVENCVFNVLRRRTKDIAYGQARGREVDFVLPGACYEVKYSDRVNRDDVIHLRDMNADRKVVVTRNQAGRIDGMELTPFWRFLMEEGQAGGSSW
ncbi:MAG: ATP-binding protein [Candidatus Thermoplasmatota archaeon]|nr:ATP-binding protein [Candidatus Thermoplasmatota archaeon]